MSAEQVRQIANDLDMHSMSTNDGFVGRRAQELEALADSLDEATYHHCATCQCAGTICNKTVWCKRIWGHPGACNTKRDEDFRDR